jgi:arsenite methyltransferase
LLTVNDFATRESGLEADPMSDSGATRSQIQGQPAATGANGRSAAVAGTLIEVRRDRARYGVDGGYGGIPFFVLAGAGLVAGDRWANRRDKRLAGALARIGIMAVLGVAAGYFYSTGPGKLSVWKELLDELGLRGDEHVLDIGCGRGAVLISAARRLPGGRATGVDIWRLRDQTGNTRAAAERNAMAEGVSERVEFVHADARDLPLPPESFDVVLSNLTFSNIRGGDQRARALREAVRVLRPGGRMRVIDDRADRYAPVLQSAGCVDVEVRHLDWRTSFGLPGHHMTLVLAQKPAAGPASQPGPPDPRRCPCGGSPRTFGR